MLALNLLSPTKKHRAKKQIIFVSVQIFVSLFLIAVCITGMALLITKLIMQNSFDQAVRQGALVTQEYGALNQKVYAINNKIIFLQKIQKEFTVWSPQLIMLTTLVPQNIQLTSFNINGVSGDIRISGYAKTRDALLIYKTQLEESDMLTAVNLPIENLLEATDVSFEITGKMQKK